MTKEKKTAKKVFSTKSFNTRFKPKNEPSSEKLPDGDPLDAPVMENSQEVASADNEDSLSTEVSKPMNAIGYIKKGLDTVLNIFCLFDVDFCPNGEIDKAVREEVKVLYGDVLEEMFLTSKPSDLQAKIEARGNLTLEQYKIALLLKYIDLKNVSYNSMPGLTLQERRDLMHFTATCIQYESIDLMQVFLEKMDKSDAYSVTQEDVNLLVTKEFAN